MAERTGRVRRGATAVRELGRRQHVGAWLVVAVVVALVLVAMAATGQFGRGEPYYGQRIAEGETVELDRWTMSVDRIWLERKYGSEEQFVIALHLRNDAKETSFGPIDENIAVAFDDEVMFPSDCDTMPAHSTFQPGIMTRATCTISVTTDGLLIPFGDLPVKVVLFAEQPDPEPGLGERWQSTKPAYYVETVAKDRRERE